MGKKSGKGGLPAFIPRPPTCLKQFAEETFDSKKAEEEVKSIQNRLRGLLTQVWEDNAIFQRIMYKNQNQHRRTVYFRRLLQVRRDLLLLESFPLKEIVEALPHCISFSKQKALPPKAVLNSLGQGLQSKEQMILTVQRRLLGVSRLLQMMADPILNAGLAIEGLLSQAFFMPFALTVLALLARFRMILIKALYEVISAFNLVSASVKKLEIPSVQTDVPLCLECRWDGVKLVFFEKAPPPPPPQELVPLPSSLSDAEKLPDVGWFIEDRSTSVQGLGVLKPALYEREESFILEGFQFELLGEEDDVEAAAVPISTLGAAMESEVSSGIEEITRSCSAEMTGDLREAVSTPCSSREAKIFSGTKQKLAQDLKSDARAELESWKAELESWGSSKDKSVDKSKKKRVAYVAVELGASKKSKTLKTGHFM